MTFAPFPHPRVGPSVQTRFAIGLGEANLHNGDVLDLYEHWPAPSVIVSDGAYGVGGFPGDPRSVTELSHWYEQHIQAWTRFSTGQTTLWFWNTELGWATVHPLLEQYGWEYRGCNIWDKGKSHIAGNVNSKTLRKFPQTTEVCVQYVKPQKFTFAYEEVSMQDWLRLEWLRTGLPLYKTNEACQVANAATRKYFTACHLWYFPPAEMFERFSAYANTYGIPEGRPYFSFDGQRPILVNEWEAMRPIFHLPFGITNVWNVQQLRSKERERKLGKVTHFNQKPIELMNLIVNSSSKQGDVVWEPFGGLGTASLSAIFTGRRAFCAEIMDEVYKDLTKRFDRECNNRIM